MKNDYIVSAFYFPNFHKGDKHNELYHGKGWNEWRLVEQARPRFLNHQMPKVPLWGYEDESDPKVMEKKIEACINYGIDNLIFDWYYYDDGPFLNKCIDEGFLNAKNNRDMKFSIMYANHDWLDIHPLPLAYINDQKCELKGTMKSETFDAAIDYIINHYFICPNYFRLDGGLFLSIYEINKFVATYGGINNAKAAIKRFRNKVEKAGLGKLHLNAIVWGIKILEGESNSTLSGRDLIELGFDSVMSYVWVHEHEIPHFPETEYSEYRKICENDFHVLTKRFEGIPYYPNVTCGWDPSPRANQTDIYENRGYPFMSVLKNNTAKEFKKALLTIKKQLDNSHLKTKFLTINAFNEWTEGSYLEPDTEEKFGKLEAIKSVFKC